MLLKIGSTLIILTLLSGCLQTSKPEISSTPISTIKSSSSPIPVQTSSDVPKGYLRPDVDVKQPAVSDKDPITFRYMSELELDRTSLENLIKDQMISNLKERKEFNYTIKWKSDKEFTLTFQGLLPRETIHFSTLHVKTKEPGILNEDFTNQFDNVFQHIDANTLPAIVLTDFNGFNHRYVESNTTEKIELMKQVGTAEVFFITFDNQNFKITDMNKGSTITVPLPIAKESNLEKLHGYKKYMFSNKYYRQYTYVVMSHSKVYRVNTLTKKSELIYTSPLPILGISASENGRSIGLMVAQDHELRSETDLLVINDKGEVTLNIPNAAFLSHSDGYLTSHQLEWIDDNKIRTMTEFPSDSSTGQNEIDITKKTIIKIPNTNDDDDEIMKKITEKEKEFIPYFSPDKSKLIYVTRSNANFYKELWMTEKRSNTTRFVGIGDFLGWTSANTVAWVEYPSVGR